MGVSSFSIENCLSHNVEKFRKGKGTLLFSRKFRVSKNFMRKRGISRFSIEKLVSHSTNKLRRETILCFTKILVLKSFLGEGGGGGREVVSRFSS